MGKLYLNYPMIESYLHVKALPDITYIERKIPITLQPGDRYKGLVKKESVIVKLIDLPHRINDLLAGERYQVMDLQKRRECCEKILNISNEAMQEKQLDEALFVIGDSKKEKTLKYQLKDWLKKTEYVSKKQNYWQYMRNIFQQVIRQNICKAYRIQKNCLGEEELKGQFELIDLETVLKIQNKVSQDEVSGFIWVLSTCIFLVPDYNFKLL